MKTLTTLLLILTFISCKTSTSQKNEVVETQTQPAEVALNFINSYVAFCNSGNLDKSLTEWVSEQPTVTENFKSELKRIITESEKEDPEFGLGFDPIFNAQDYPDKGFELVKSTTTLPFITVKAIDWQDWEMKIKMSETDNRWLVDGIGIINVP